MTEHVQLFCVGCGSHVTTVEAGKCSVLAIACWCGANAPILHGGDTFMPPASLVRASQDWSTPTVPHLEYWLGYSDHESRERTAVTLELREIGSISQAECTADEKCKGAYDRGVARWNQQKGDQQEQETRAQEESQALGLLERERDYRIQEIGEV